MSSPVQAVYSLRVFLAIVIAVAVLRYAQDVFVPLALAILLTFLLAPLVDGLQRIRINRTVAVILLGCAHDAASLGGLLWVVFHQFTDLANQLPSYRRQLRANLAGVTGALKGGVAVDRRSPRPAHPRVWPGRARRPCARQGAEGAGRRARP